MGHGARPSWGAAARRMEDPVTDHLAQARREITRALKLTQPSPGRLTTAEQEVRRRSVQERLVWALDSLRRHEQEDGTDCGATTTTQEDTAP